MDASYGPIFRNIYSWIKRGQVSSVKLTGIRVNKVPTKDFTPDYQFTIGAADLGFLETDGWIQAIGEYFVCIYDQYLVGGIEIETRIVLFTTGLKVQFLFSPHTRSQIPWRTPSLRSIERQAILARSIPIHGKFSIKCWKIITRQLQILHAGQ